MLTVLKFGGSSLADAERLRRAAETVLNARRAGDDTVVVVSAMGDTTDALEARAYAIAPTPPPRELDALIATGEWQSAALMAIMLSSMGAPALSLSGAQAGIYTDARHGDAEIALTLPARVGAALREGYIPIVAGFQGVDITGDVTTLGRGGSDTSAVALCGALNAARCDIYTDVSGIFTADPRLVEAARRLERIDYGDMYLLAQAGSQVLHARSVRLAEESGAKLRVLSSAGAEGSSIVCALAEGERPDYSGVTRDARDGRVTLVGKACRSHTLPELAALLSDAGVSVRGGGMGAGYASVRVDPRQLIFALRTVHRYYFE